MIGAEPYHTGFLALDRAATGVDPDTGKATRTELAAALDREARRMLTAIGASGGSRPTSAGPARLDLAQLEPFLNRLIAVANGVPGCFVVFGAGEENPVGNLWQKLRSQIHVVENDGNALTGLIAAIEAVNRTPGLNAYISIGLFKPRAEWATPKGRGSEDDLVGTLACVGDFDKDHDPATCLTRLPLAPHVLIATSADNRQSWIFLDKPYPVDEAKPVFHALVRAAGTDHTHSCEHIFRPPGTWNWPNEKKCRPVAEGGEDRSREPQLARVVATPAPGPGKTINELRAATLTMYPDVFDAKPQPGRTRSPTNRKNRNPAAIEDFDWQTPATTPRKYIAALYFKRELGLKIEGLDRSRHAAKIIERCRRSGWTAEETFVAMWAHATAPVMGHYDQDEDRLRADIERLWTKDAPGSDAGLRGQMMAGVERDPDSYRVFDTGSNRAPVPRRPIHIVGSEIDVTLDALDTALTEQSIGIFQRNNRLVRPGSFTVDVKTGGEPVKVDGLVEVNAVGLVEYATHAASFTKWDARMNAAKAIDCPLDVAQKYAERLGRWGLRPLIGTINAPTLRADGSLIDQPGYDAATGILYRPQRGMVWPGVPANPTWGDALEASLVLDELIGEFPFVSKEAHSVALAAMLTGVIRRTLPTAPGFGFTAPKPGTGKGLLCNTIARIAAGSEPARMTPGTNEETEKRMSGLLMQGPQVIEFDNIDTPIGGPALASVLTERTASLRPLGSSKIADHLTNSLFLFNGNSLVVMGEICRRVLVCGMDAEHEHPEQRVFDFDPVEFVRHDRGRYVAACLTILLAYRAAGMPPQTDPVGSYEVWSRSVRDALIWLGEADPWLTVAQSKADDPEAARTAAIFYHWADVIGVGVPVTTKQIIDAAVQATSTKGPGLIDALHDVAAPFAKGGANAHVDARRLGEWIRKNKHVLTGGWWIVLDGITMGASRWRLEIKR